MLVGPNHEIAWAQSWAKAGGNLGTTVLCPTTDALISVLGVAVGRRAGGVGSAVGIHSHGANDSSVANNTLGFSKIFAIGLPERTDKRDAFALTSALTGFHVEFMDGVRGESIPDQAVPPGVDREALMETNLGSWRGHMNVIRRQGPTQKPVDEDLESALIIEDDMDWDVRLKTQLKQIAQGARYFMPSSKVSSSPYGDSWDVLWLGHCGEIFPEQLPENKGKPGHPKYTILNDKTVPPRHKLTGLVDFASYPEFTRWVHVSGGPICSFAYALSQSGARKVLFDLSIDRLGGPFDNALAGFCRDGASGNTDGLQARCLSVTPPVFFHHRAKGRLSSDSDIQGFTSTDVREKGTTENIMWSARNNLRNMMLGLEMENQF
ncbi:hypothetical protein NUW58_g4966 [Xylaria curta]|uniref:Uncharacterized protein n=1 Tax=Xylaria curta TaxID=42375 RepID=A0ACC1P4R3_9PEZI|nr:hypothetical protein NUW58_g4966 [Xylaria curta]